MGSTNPGSFFNPKNLIPALMTGGLSYGVTELGRNLKPNAPPAPTPPPAASPPPMAMDSNPQLTAQQRARKLSQMQYGFASTLTNSASADMGQMPGGLKTRLGQ